MSREGRRRWAFNETFLVGRQDNPLLKRWRLVQTPWFGVYVHHLYREDLDPVPHDHPWSFVRMVVRGGYGEHHLSDPARGRVVVRAQRRWRLGWFPTTHAHRVVVVKPGTVSVVIVGPKRRAWGFWTPESLPNAHGLPGCSSGCQTSRTWVDYRDALGLRPTEGVTS
jgi:hypothetical protein